MIPPALIPAFIRQINPRAIALAVMLLTGIGLWIGGFVHGRDVTLGEQAQRERDTAIAYAGEIVRLQGINEGLEADNETRRQQAATLRPIITREVTRYASRPDHCLLPGAFRLLHDAAATGEAALAQAIPLDAASAQPVADPAVLATVTANYDACRENADRLIAWQQRYLQLEQAP